jgi:hypothetical protein
LNIQENLDIQTWFLLDAKLILVEMLVVVAKAKLICFDENAF